MLRIHIDNIEDAVHRTVVNVVRGMNRAEMDGVGLQPLEYIDIDLLVVTQRGDMSTTVSDVGSTNNTKVGGAGTRTEVTVESEHVDTVQGSSTADNVRTHSGTTTTDNDYTQNNLSNGADIATRVNTWIPA